MRHKVSRNTIQPNAHNGLGGFSAWPAQARAFSDQIDAAAEERETATFLRRTTKGFTIHPTECPQWLASSFPPGSPSQGILFLRTRSPDAYVRVRRWSQKDAPMAWVDSPPLIRPSRGVYSGLGSGD
jgi:hypothetical protein